MNTRCARDFAVGAIFAFSLAAAAATPYEDAVAQGKSDALNPELRAWYLNVLRPAFRPVFQPLLEKCLAVAPEAAVRGFGLVFTVTSEGKVGQTFWRAENAFTACLDPELRVASFPNSPKPEFFFAFEAGAQQPRT